MPFTRSPQFECENYLWEKLNKKVYKAPFKHDLAIVDLRYEIHIKWTVSRKLKIDQIYCVLQKLLLHFVFAYETLIV